MADPIRRGRRPGPYSQGGPVGEGLYFTSSGSLAAKFTRAPEAVKAGLFAFELALMKDTRDYAVRESSGSLDARQVRLGVMGRRLGEAWRIQNSKGFLAKPVQARRAHPYSLRYAGTYPPLPINVSGLHSPGFRDQWHYYVTPAAGRPTVHGGLYNTARYGPILETGFRRGNGGMIERRIFTAVHEWAENQRAKRLRAEATARSADRKAFILSKLKPTLT